MNRSEEDLAALLAEHRSWSEVCSDTDGWHYECSCGEPLPTNDGHVEAWEDLAAHQAEVITAAGWRHSRKLAQKLADAWREGTETEAAANGHEITMTCSLDNPFLEWTEPDAEGRMFSRPIVPEDYDDWEEA